MRRQRAQALLIDFDGVLRQWDPAIVARTEDKYGLTPGRLRGVAFEWPRLLPVITGAVSHDEWMAGVAEAIADEAGGLPQARAAVAEWQSYRGAVDAELLAFVREVRAAGLPVGIAANGTDRFDADLATVGLSGEVDLVVNSSVIGVHKPAPEFFAKAGEAIGVPASSILFVDDEDRAVRGARAAGMSAYRWNGPEHLPYLRAALALG